MMDSPEHLPMLEQWLRSYHPEELVRRKRQADSRAQGAGADRRAYRIGANPHANGGLLMHQLRLPDFRDYGLNVSGSGQC